MPAFEEHSYKRVLVHTKTQSTLVQTQSIG